MKTKSLKPKISLGSVWFLIFGAMTVNLFFYIKLIVSKKVFKYSGYLGFFEVSKIFTSKFFYDIIVVIRA